MIPFTVDAVSYGLSAALLFGLSARAATATAPADRRITAGLRWLWHQRSVMRVVWFASAINFTAVAATVAVVVVLRDRGTPAAVIGVLMACVGAGGVVGAILARHFIEILGNARLRSGVAAS